MKIAAGTSRGVTTDLPGAAKPDHLTEALRRHGVLLAGRVRDVTTEGPRDTLVSRIARLKLTLEGVAEKAPTSAWHAAALACAYHGASANQGRRRCACQ
jgi:hypothetical protein